MPERDCDHIRMEKSSMNSLRVPPLRIPRRSHDRIKTPQNRAYIPHIPFRRFTTQILVSVLGVYLSRLTIRSCKSTLIIVAIAPSVGCIISLTSHYVIPSYSASQPYCIAACLLLLSLHQVTTLLSQHAVAHMSFSASQHLAVHFALTFFVLTELEFYRSYIAFGNYSSSRKTLTEFPCANVDWEFPISRDPFCYTMVLPACWSRCLDGPAESDGCLAQSLSWSNGVVALMLLLFYIVGGFFNSTVKQLVNPSADGKDCFLMLMGNHSVLFGVDQWWQPFLSLALLRVVRQANFLAFWGVIRGVERVWGWWRARAERWN